MNSSAMWCGACSDVYNSLGPGLKEEYYRDAIAVGLEARRVRCQVEKSFEVYYKEERVGLYYVDLWLEDGKILLEIKIAPDISPLHKAQALSYLKVTGADLALVATFGGSSMKAERLPNYLRDREAEFAWRPQPVSEGLLYPELVNRMQEACHRVHWVLGPGFLHQVYRRATLIELRETGLNYEYLKQLPVVYQGRLLGQQDVRLILVEGSVALATFALAQEGEALSQRLKSYLRRLDLRLGLLANFYGTQPSIAPVRVGGTTTDREYNG